MPIAFPTLPPLPEYPPTATDAQRSQWGVLAQLHATKASVQASEAGAEANNRLADTHAQILASLVARDAAVATVLDSILQAWDRHTAAVDRLAAAIEATPVGGGTNSAGEGLTSGDVGIVAGLVAAIKPTT